jgi:aminobenzoyl-glutamate utilization protein B
VVRYPSNIPNLQGHHWSNAIAMATPIAHKGVVAGSKVVAMTTLDLMASEKLRRDARAYFTDVQTKDQKYVPVLTPQDRPTIEMNADTQGRFREQLRQYYYDPSRYDTYLEQLGIRFPTLSRSDAPAQ